MTRDEAMVIANKIQNKIFDSFSEDGKIEFLGRNDGLEEFIANEIYHSNLKLTKFIDKAIQQSELVIKNGSHYLLVPYWFCQKRD